MCSLSPGELVPMPTSPAEVMRRRSAFVETKLTLSHYFDAAKSVVQRPFGIQTMRLFGIDARA